MNRYILPSLAIMASIAMIWFLKQVVYLVALPLITIGLVILLLIQKKEGKEINIGLILVVVATLIISLLGIPSFTQSLCEGFGCLGLLFIPALIYLAGILILLIEVLKKKGSIGAKSSK